MEIAGILTAGRFLSSALGQLAKPGQPQEAAGNQSAEATRAPVGPPVDDTAFREILARYDVTDISPREFSDMIRKLHEAGALTGQQFQELSLIRVDLDLDGVDPDESLNLVEFYADKLSELRQSQDDSEDLGGSVSANQPAQLAPVERRLEWVAKFAAIQADSDHVGLNALA